MTPLHIYLRDHEAGAQAGLDLFRRAARGQRRRAWSGELEELKHEVRDDLTNLHTLMRRVGTTPDPLLGGVARLAERLGRLKPNGRLVRRAPLSDLVEMEGLLDAVFAKRSGWRALQAAGVGERPGVPDLAELVSRADDQRERLSVLHAQAAEHALGSTARG